MSVLTESPQVTVPVITREQLKVWLALGEICNVPRQLRLLPDDQELRRHFKLGRQDDPLEVLATLPPSLVFLNGRWVYRCAAAVSVDGELLDLRRPSDLKRAASMFITVRIRPEEVPLRVVKPSSRLVSTRSLVQAALVDTSVPIKPMKRDIGQDPIELSGELLGWAVILFAYSPRLRSGREVGQLTLTALMHELNGVSAVVAKKILSDLVGVHILLSHDSIVYRADHTPLLVCLKGDEGVVATFDLLNEAEVTTAAGVYMVTD